MQVQNNNKTVTKVTIFMIRSGTKNNDVSTASDGQCQTTIRLMIGYPLWAVLMVL
jgi:hypothetical protein